MKFSLNLSRPFSTIMNETLSFSTTLDRAYEKTLVNNIFSLTSALFKNDFNAFLSNFISYSDIAYPFEELSCGKCPALPTSPSIDS